MELVGWNQRHKENVLRLNQVFHTVRDQVKLAMIVSGVVEVEEGRR